MAAKKKRKAGTAKERAKRARLRRKAKRRMSQRHAHILLKKLERGVRSNDLDILTDHEVGKLITRTDRKTRKKVARILRVG